MTQSTITTDVAIVGGGVVGCAAAYYLAMAGIEVVLLERRELNREASGTNAGSLHLQLLRQPSWSKEWISKVKPSLELHRLAAISWQGLEAELDSDLGIHLGGGVMVAESPIGVRRLRDKVRLERSLGIDTELITQAELRALVPVLNDKLLAADYKVVEGHANPLLVAPAFAMRATGKGARVLTHSEVQSIELQSGGGFTLACAGGLEVRARRVVNAAGAWSGQVTRMVGLTLPMGGDVLHMNVTEPLPPSLDFIVQHVERRLTLKQTSAGTFLIGGGWPGSYDLASNTKLTHRDSVEGNLWVASQTVPLLKQATVIRTWGGLGANTSDWLPVIGEAKRVRGFYTLFVGLGFTLGPISAQLLSEIVTGAEPSANVDAYSPERF
jgi:glycine/D-amino acid oxidase-like deaminating enzyme